MCSPSSPPRNGVSQQAESPDRRTASPDRRMESPNRRPSQDHHTESTGALQRREVGEAPLQNPNGWEKRAGHLNHIIIPFSPVHIPLSTLPCSTTLCTSSSRTILRFHTQQTHAFCWPTHSKGILLLRQPKGKPKGKPKGTPKGKTNSHPSFIQGYSKSLRGEFVSLEGSASHSTICVNT